MSSPKTKKGKRNTLLPLVAVLVTVLAVLIVVAVLLPEPEPKPQAQTPSTHPSETEPAPLLTGWQIIDGVHYYYSETGSPLTGVQTLDDKTYFFHTDGAMAVGVVDTGNGLWLMDAQGIQCQSGWQEYAGSRYYVRKDLTLHTGWLEEGGTKYYLRADGSAATGQLEIAGKRYFFSSTGANLVVVNPWNAVPEDYTMNLKALPLDVASDGMKVDESCYDALVEMLRDCTRECTQVCVISSYRSIEYQEKLFNRRIQRFVDQGYSEEEARELAASIVAVPGTSEHHLALAVDIIDTDLWELEEEQEDMPGQIWLMENCWKYGFILRYPKGTTDTTGIIYEPWHYRYVGKELAAEIYELRKNDPLLTLETYLASLTK